MERATLIAFVSTGDPNFIGRKFIKIWVIQISQFLVIQKLKLKLVNTSVLDLRFNKICNHAIIFRMH